MNWLQTILLLMAVVIPTGFASAWNQDSLVIAKTTSWDTTTCSYHYDAGGLLWKIACVSAKQSKKKTTIFEYSDSKALSKETGLDGDGAVVYRTDYRHTGAVLNSSVTTFFDSTYDKTTLYGYSADGKPEWERSNFIKGKLAGSLSDSLAYFYKAGVLEKIHYYNFQGSWIGLRYFYYNADGSIERTAYYMGGEFSFISDVQTYFYAKLSSLIDKPVSIRREFTVKKNYQPEWFQINGVRRTGSRESY